MHDPFRRPRKLTSRVVVVAALAAAGFVAAPSSSAATTLTGVFTITAGSCAGGITGSYFRMILHNGSPSGPFMSNSDSSCSDQSYTLLSPGDDGGLISGHYQQQASPAFDGSGNGVTNRITKPVRFYGVNFATATNSVDPQTGKSVAAPQIAVSGDTLSADLRAFAVSWNNQQFNQGSPKPDGSMPGNTRAVAGNYDAATGAYTLQWTSQVQGGPFDGFTGLWHLTGRFVAAGSAPASSASPRSTTGTAPATRATTRTAHHGPAGTGAPTAPTSPGAVGTAPGAPAQSGAASNGSGGSTATGAGPAVYGGISARHQAGKTRWPWELLAFIAIGVVAVVGVRRARPGRAT